MVTTATDRPRNVLPSRATELAIHKSQTCTMTSSSRDGYRSVLPHEPLCSVTVEGDERGHVHLQSSFSPKPIGKNKKTDDAAAADPASCLILSPDDIERALVKSLSTATTTLQGLPNYSPISVEVCDPTKPPPYGKVRLTYDNAVAARDVVSYLRHQCISPSHLLLPAVELAPSDGGDAQYKFSTRPIQATQITRAPVQSEDMCWNRSNPPKFRRLLHTREGSAGEDADTLRKTRDSTRFVFMTNILTDDMDGEGPKGAAISKLFDAPHHFLDALRKVLNPVDSTGYGVEIFLSPSKAKKWLKSVHIGMRNHDDAAKLMDLLQGKSIDLELPAADSQGTVAVATGALFLDYVAPTHRSWEKAKRGETARGSSAACTSSTKDVVVPGLVIVPEFVSEEEEATLMALLTGPTAPWAPSQVTMNKIGSGTVRRRVQHYGYVFDYETADVLRDRTAKGGGCPPMPARPVLTGCGGDENHKDVEAYISSALKKWDSWGLLSGVIERTRTTNFASALQADGPVTFPNLNQLTVNEYRPGQGIGSHIDTPSAFGDGLISISLNSGTVMEFRRQGSDEKKLVHLPPRSLCLMSGPARYEWEHMIVSRMTDTVDGKIVPRNLRVSLTLRTGITKPDGESKIKPLELVESSDYPLCWVRDNITTTNGKDENDLKDDAAMDIATPATEREHVHAVYDAIATQWHHTRGKRGVLWPGATQFLKELPQGSMVADVGCGDGKYFPAIIANGSYVVGTDMSRPLLQAAVDAGKQSLQSGNDAAPESRRVGSAKEMLNGRPAVAVADCMHLPLRTNSFDAAICIAVMHHLSTLARRIRCLQELARVVKVGGLINIQAWAIEQEEGSKRKFAATDVFVPFNAQPKYLDTSKIDGEQEKEGVTDEAKNANKGVAQIYSEAYEGAEYDERKGLVVFQRYCHMYREGELEELVEEVDNLELVTSGFESGNFFIIVKVIS